VILRVRQLRIERHRLPERRDCVRRRTLLSKDESQPIVRARRRRIRGDDFLERSPRFVEAPELDQPIGARERRLGRTRSFGRTLWRPFDFALGALSNVDGREQDDEKDECRGREWILTNRAKLPLKSKEAAC
jgi:hypothetical protein